MVILELEPFPSLSILIFCPNIFRSIRRFTTLLSSTKCNLQNLYKYIYSLLYLEMFIRRKKDEHQIITSSPSPVPIQHQSSLYNLIKRIIPLIVSMCEDCRRQRVAFVCPCTSQRDVISFTWADLTYFFVWYVLSSTKYQCIRFLIDPMKHKRKIK